MKAVPALNDIQKGMVAEYMRQRTGAVFTHGEFQAFAFMSDSGVFQGGAVLNNYRGHDVEISTAAETPMAYRHKVIGAVFQYAFVQLKCVRMTAITTKKNARARAFLESLGFELEGKVRRGYDGRRDALIYGLMAQDCRFLGGFTSGEIDAESAAAA